MIYHVELRRRFPDEPGGIESVFGTQRETARMPTYAVPSKKTNEERMICPEETRTRRQRGVEMNEEFGGEFRPLYYGSGRYNIVGIADMPNGESVGKLQSAYESLGLTSIEAWEVYEPEE